MTWQRLGFREVDEFAVYEQKRLAIQAQLETAKKPAERNKVGQFSTPTELSLSILRYAKALLPNGDRVRFLDPAFGTGVFYSALLKVFAQRDIEAAEGFEIDLAYVKVVSSLWSDTSLKLSCEDFTRLSPSSEEEDKFNLIICNPPYVRHHHLQRHEKSRLQHLATNVSEIRLSGLAGLYCYFLALAHGWMRQGGIAGWLVPSEFMDVNYGQSLKQYLLQKVTLVRIHRFEPADVQFSDALVSSAIVWFRKEPPPLGHRMEFSLGGTLEHPYLSRLIDADILENASKWTRFPATEIVSLRPEVTLGDFFTIKRGLATGDNSFFILSKQQIEERHLPFVCFRPILPSPRYLPIDEIPSTAEEFPYLEAQLFLLDCNLSEEAIQSQYPTLWKYLQEGRSKGVTQRYLCRHRQPWYTQENRPPSLFLCTYIGRSNIKRGSPFRFILNYSKATATNTYLILYPKPTLIQMLDEEPGLAKEIWRVLNATCVQSLIENGRVYGGGMHKLEPRELAMVPSYSLSSMLQKKFQKLSQIP